MLVFWVSQHVLQCFGSKEEKIKVDGSFIFLIDTMKRSSNIKFSLTEYVCERYGKGMPF